LGVLLPDATAVGDSLFLLLGDLGTGISQQENRHSAFSPLENNRIHGSRFFVPVHFLYMAKTHIVGARD